MSGAVHEGTATGGPAKTLQQEYDEKLAQVREHLAELTKLTDAHERFQSDDPTNPGFVGDLEEALDHLEEARMFIGWISDADEGAN